MRKRTRTLGKTRNEGPGYFCRQRSLFFVGLSITERSRHYNDSNCHICKKLFLPNQLRIPDNDHLPGKYRGPTHNNYNLNFKDSHVIPVIFHNLSPAMIRILFSRRSLICMRDRLDKLSSYLAESQLSNLRSQFSDLSVEQFKLLTRKGIFLYDYIDIPGRLEETALPPRQSFRNRLPDNDISEEAYNHAVEDAANLDVSAIPSDHHEGYILEVDLEYSREFHDKHADLPFCMVREKPPGASQEKLLDTLTIRRFQQSIWLLDYIELNMRLRTASTNEFEKDLFKLMNNAVFGKTMENNLVTIQLSKLSAEFDKPLYVGMSISDISKICLYEFHYDYMLPTFGSKYRGMYTNTDSLIYSVECEDVHSDRKCDLTQFDTSDYPNNNQYDLPRINKKISGLMKDENNGRIMAEFVALRAKKCILSRCRTARELLKNTKVSKDCLDNFTVQSRNQNLIRSKLHQIFSISQRKVALSPYDDKRFVTPGTFLKARIRKLHLKVPYPWNP
ncbi:uncharacterized protein [Prorops nasuta]|uniref:uncharacterized protein n=1 Tax=Prorops nasuta TaxID=863751 RepID=UPI0034CDEF2F